MPAESGVVPSSLVPGGPALSSLTCTYRGPLLACSPGQMSKSPNVKSPKQGATEDKNQYGIIKKNVLFSPWAPLGFYLQCRCRLHLLSSKSLCPDHVPRTEAQAHLWSLQEGHITRPAVETLTHTCTNILLTFSRCPMSGLCHVSILIKKLSFIYSFCREKRSRSG